MDFDYESTENTDSSNFSWGLQGRVRVCRNGADLFLENVVDTADWVVASENEYSINFLICPSAQRFVVGTYFITIYAESQAKFELEVLDAYDPLPKAPTVTFLK